MKFFFNFILMILLIIFVISFVGGLFFSILAICLIIAIFCRSLSIFLGMLIYGLVGLFVGWLLSCFFETSLTNFIAILGIENMSLCHLCGVCGMVYGAIRGIFVD